MKKVEERERKKTPTSSLSHHHHSFPRSLFLPLLHVIPLTCAAAILSEADSAAMPPRASLWLLRKPAAAAAKARRGPAAGGEGDAGEVEDAAEDDTIPAVATPAARARWPAQLIFAFVAKAGSSAERCAKAAPVEERMTKGREKRMVEFLQRPDRKSLSKRQRKKCFSVECFFFFFYVDPPLFFPPPRPSLFFISLFPREMKIIFSFFPSPMKILFSFFPSPRPAQHSRDREKLQFQSLEKQRLS